MTYKYILSAMLLALVSTSILAANKSIYGEDNRIDYTELKDEKLKIQAQATAAMIPSNLIREIDDETSRIKGKMLSQYGICEYERFSRQVAAADCSGFLIAPDLIVTAGHCVKSRADCSFWRWVFDYRTSKNYKIGRKLRVATDKIYNCKEVIVSKLDTETGDDFAIIRLNRPVLDRAPLLIRKSGEVAKEAKLSVIGYPSGLPVKYANGATIVSNDHAKYFLATLDTFQGNSGSAVINDKTGVVEGILVRGNEDYHYERRRGKRCLVPTVCSDKAECEGEGEGVTRITQILEYL